MMKTKELFSVVLLAFASIIASAKEDVTSKLSDAALADESTNWALVSNGGNHSAATNGYHESWHNTFTLTQTVADLPSGYYRVSIQAAVQTSFSESISLTATAGSKTSVPAHPVYSIHDSYSNMAAWWAADATGTGNADLNRIYTTVKVDEGESLTIKFEQTATDQWFVYGQFKLEQLTDAEGQSSQVFEAAYNTQSKLFDMSSGRYKQRFEAYDAASIASGERLVYEYTNLPNGKYNVTLNGGASFTSGRGFSGSSGDGLTVLFANEKTTAVSVEERLIIANDAFVDYTVANALVSDGTLRIGFRNIAEGANWFVGSVKSIEYLGEDLSDYEEAYKNALTAAKALTSEKMNADTKTALQNIITQYDVDFSTYNNVTSVTDAITAIQNATQVAQTSINQYAEIAAEVAQLDEAGQKAFAATESGQKLANNTLKTTDDITADYASAIKAQTSANAEFTGLIVNPSFETGDLTGWEVASDNGGNFTLMTRSEDTDPIVGTYWYEKYSWSGKIDIHQTITGVPAGTYVLGVRALDQQSSLKLVASSGDITSETIVNTSSAADFTVEINVPQDNSNLTIGLYCESHTASKWVGFDNFTLKHSPFAFEDLTAVSGKMNTEIETAQTEAIAAYNDGRTSTTYAAAKAAIAAAEASVADYAAKKTALDAQKALMDATNVYDKEAYNATGWTTLATAYDNGTLTANDEVVNPNTATGENYKYNFLLTPWTIGGEACNEKEKSLYINTWSVEGESDGTGFLVPFLEYWTGDANSLADNTIEAKLSDLENGQYLVTAWVRVRAKNSATGSEATGITLSVNDGDAVSVTEGGTPVGTQFVLQEVTATGLVIDGTLSIDFKVADTNVSWLSFKNVMYTKNRDLTDEEKVAGTEDIAALQAAIDEVVKAHTIGYQAGAYAPYTNKEAIATLENAQALVTTSAVSRKTVLDAIEALKSATWTANTTEMNALENGDFEASYAAVADAGVTSDRAIYLPEGWSFRKNGINVNDMIILASSDAAADNFKSITSLENGGAHTLLYRGKWGTTTDMDFYQTITLPAGTYQLSCDAWKSGLGGDGKIYVGADNEVSLSGNETSWRTLSLIFTLDEEKTVEVGFNIVHNSDNSEKFIGFDNFVLTTIDTAPISVADAGYATFVAPFDVAVPEDVTAYTVDGANDEGVLTLTEVATTIGANTPVVLEGSLGATTVYGKAVEGTPEKGLLVGVYKDIKAPNGSYVLQNHEGRVGFYKVDTSKAEPSVKANHAYLVADGTEVKSFFFDNETAIRALEALTSGEAQIYDLNGRRWSKLQKGINLVNGKKILVK